MPRFEGGGAHRLKLLTLSLFKPSRNQPPKLMGFHSLLIDFLCHIVNENQTIRIYQPATAEENINKIRFGVLKYHCDHFWSGQILIIFFNED